MNNKDNIIFERQMDNYRLKKVYDVTVAGSKYRDIDYSVLSKGPVEFKEEKDNEFGYGNEDYEDLMDLEIELSKLNRK